VTAEAPTDKRKAIVEALMDLASRRAWHEIEITDVAKAANVSLAEFRDLFPSKGAVLGALSRQSCRQIRHRPLERSHSCKPRVRWKQRSLRFKSRNCIDIMI